MNVDINTSGTKQIGLNIISHAENIKNNINSLNNCLGKLSLLWLGDRAKAYLNNMTGINMKELNELQEIINSYGEFLRDVPNAYQALDEAFVNKSIE